MKKILFYIGFILSISSLVHGAAIDERKTDIYFGNGVWNNRQSAVIGQLELEDFIIYKLEKTEAQVKLAFNHTNGHRRDLIETYYQLYQLGQISFGYFTALSLAMTPDVPEGMLPIYLAGMISEETEDLDVMVNNYVQNIEDGHTVLLVSHSQGNLFGLRAFDNLESWQKNYFLQFSVASPGNRVANEGEWVTNTNDLVIKKLIDLTLIGEDSLDANVTIPITSSDFSGHEFIATYLADIDSVNKIKGALERSFERLQKVPSQWQKSAEIGCGCDKRIEVEHKYDSFLNELMEGRLVIPFEEEQKLYPIDSDYVKADVNGTSVDRLNTETICTVLKDAEDNNVSIIANNTDIPNPQSGAIEVTLTWTNGADYDLALDMPGSVLDVQSCGMEHVYVESEYEIYPGHCTVIV